MTPIEQAVFVTGIALCVCGYTRATFNAVRPDGKTLALASSLILLGLAARLWYQALYPIVRPH
jgi:hypothetical protein